MLGEGIADGRNGVGGSPSGRGSRLRRQECPVFPLFLSFCRPVNGESDISKGTAPPYLSATGTAGRAGNGLQFTGCCR